MLQPCPLCGSVACLAQSKAVCRHTGKRRPERAGPSVSALIAYRTRLAELDQSAKPPAPPAVVLEPVRPARSGRRPRKALA